MADEEVVSFDKMSAAEKSSVSRQGAGVGRSEHKVAAPVNQPALGRGVGAPEYKYYRVLSPV